MPDAYMEYVREAKDSNAHVLAVATCQNNKQQNLPSFQHHVTQIKSTQIQTYTRYKRCYRFKYVIYRGNMNEIIVAGMKTVN